MNRLIMNMIHQFVENKGYEPTVIYIGREVKFKLLYDPDIKYHLSFDPDGNFKLYNIPIFIVTNDPEHIGIY